MEVLLHLLPSAKTWNVKWKTGVVLCLAGHPWIFQDQDEIRSDVSAVAKSIELCKVEFGAKTRPYFSAHRLYCWR